MAYKRILTIQDISCLGQCSGTVALPIISACGHECCVIPSAVLSTHTYGFSGYTFCDLTEELPKIHRHWKENGIKFGCIYTGYLGSVKQISYVKRFFDDCLENGGLRIVDPAMADNGALYTGFGKEYAEAMAELCSKSDVVLPNITEACIMTGFEYKTEYNELYIKNLLASLTALGCKTIVLTGVSYRPGKTGVVVFENYKYSYYEHEKMTEGCHGTGDVYASAFTGSLMNGHTAYESAVIAADYTLACIKTTKADAEAAPLAGKEGHWYGVEFEKELPMLISRR